MRLKHTKLFGDNSIKTSFCGKNIKEKYYNPWDKTDCKECFIAMKKYVLLEERDKKYYQSIVYKN